MSRWLIALVLVVAPAIASAQSSSAPVVTAKAQDGVRQLERRVSTQTQTRNALARQYEAQLETVDRLKQQRASWRRDRELKEALEGAHAIAIKLAAAAAELGRSTSQLAAARRSLLLAIDAELSSTPAPARAAELARVRSQLAPQAPRKNLQKIVIPDLEIDPLADPEELEAQAAELLRAEQELARQAVGLDRQAKELDEVAKLRKQHERAGDLARRDDDQPQRNAREGGNNRGTAGNFGSDSAPEAGSPPSPGGGTGNDTQGSPVNAFESEASVVLSNVVDATTIETLSNASRSSDPATRARAAKRARDAVNGRLDQLRKKRLEIEAAAKARRHER